MSKKINVLHSLEELTEKNADDYSVIALKSFAKKNGFEVEKTKDLQIKSLLKAKRKNKTKTQDNTYKLKNDVNDDDRDLKINELIKEIDSLKQQLHTCQEQDLKKDHFQDLMYLIQSFPKSKKCIGEFHKIIRFLVYIYDTLPHAKFCIPKTHVSSYKNMKIPAAVLLQKEKYSNNYSVFAPSDLKQTIEYCKESFVVINFSLLNVNNNDEAHSNMIFIDKNEKTYERFEPHGEMKSFDDSYVNKFMKTEFKAKFLTNEYQYTGPLDVCPPIGPQRKQTRNNDCDDAGYCVIFSTLYAHLRVLDPSIPSQTIINRLLELSGDEILDTILRYISYIDSIVPDDKDKLKQFDKKYMRPLFT